jgi:hypothetical protein
MNGVVKGLFKTMENLSWLRVFEAGHEVPFYRKLENMGGFVIEDGLTEGRTRSCIAGLHPDDTETGYFLNLRRFRLSRSSSQYHKYFASIDTEYQKYKT